MMFSGQLFNINTVLYSIKLKGDIAVNVMGWYEENYNLKPLFAKKKPTLTSETSVSTTDCPWARETGDGDDDVMKDYFECFNGNESGIGFFKYWPPGKGLVTNFLASQNV